MLPISKIAHCLATLVKVGALELLAKHKKIGQPPKFNPNPAQFLPKTPIQGCYYKLTKYCYNVVSKGNLVRMMISNVHIY